MAQPLQVLPVSPEADETTVAVNSPLQRRAPATRDAALRAEEAATSPARSRAAEEFDRRKRLHTGRSDPVVRLAAFIIATSRQNRHEGRDVALVGDDLQSGAVAEVLGLEFDILSRALLALQDLGLVEPGEAGSLRLKDIDGLQRLADFSSQSVESAPRILPAHVVIPSRLNWGESVRPRFTSELRELSWLLFLMAGLSIVSVGFGVIVAIALF